MFNVKSLFLSLQVNLPTGGRVQISKGNSLLNIDIMPSIYDFGNTNGLCGLFDGKSSNDLQMRNISGPRPSIPNLSWRYVCGIFAVYFLQSFSFLDKTLYESLIKTTQL